jgi:hypothetical protein
MLEHIKLKSLSEQIQEDILSYASSVDDEKVFFTDDVLDELCEIVVSNFRAFDIALNQ